MRRYGFLLASLALASGYASAQEAPSPELRAKIQSHCKTKADYHTNRSASLSSLGPAAFGAKTWKALGQAYAQNIQSFDPSLNDSVLAGLVAQFKEVDSEQSFAAALQAKFRALATYYNQKSTAAEDVVKALSSSSANPLEALKQYYNSPPHQ